jgi:hypothetical protein
MWPFPVIMTGAAAALRHMSKARVEVKMRRFIIMVVDGFSSIAWDNRGFIIVELALLMSATSKQ